MDQDTTTKVFGLAASWAKKRPKTHQVKGASMNDGEGTIVISKNFALII